MRGKKDERCLWEIESAKERSVGRYPGIYVREIHNVMIDVVEI